MRKYGDRQEFLRRQKKEAERQKTEDFYRDLNQVRSINVTPEVKNQLEDLMEQEAIRFGIQVNRENIKFIIDQ